MKTLYKQTSAGGVQQWTIKAEGNEVITVYGLVGGKLQTTFDIVKEGKNLGRSNATTAEQQAQVQAQQKYDAKLKKGYVPDMDVAATTKNTLDGVEPMLAHPIDKKKKYVVFPALAQPKLDGLRCMAVIKNGKAKLYSRTQKEYISLPHITQELELLFTGNKVLDGELYNHKLKKDFNKITSIIKRDDVHKEHELVQYHIYDVVAAGNYMKRAGSLPKELISAKFLKAVETVPVYGKSDLEEYQVTCVEKGYEGAMYRNMEGSYEHKRSSGLLKVKDFQDAEFKIVGTEEGRGKLMGHIGAFYCELEDGRIFKAAPAVPQEEKEAMWKKRDSFVGKMATVKFQNYTPDGNLRFPIFKCARDD